MDRALLDQVEDYKEFMLVDELNEKLSSLVGKENVTEIGKSELGYPVMCGKLGHGKKNALIFGFPHPNEPIGSLTCMSLIKVIQASHDLQSKYTWYIVPCGDPDGAKLNEGWFKGQLSSRKFILHYYRSKDPIQTDWAFPVEYKNYKFTKVPANVMALKNLIDSVKPDLVYPVHNTVMGGNFFYISRPITEEYYNSVIALCKEFGIPVRRSPTREEYAKELKMPIYLNFGVEEAYDYYEALGKNPKTIIDFGNDSISYAKKINPKMFGMIGEVPLMYDKKIEDETPVDKTMRDILAESLKLNIETLDFVKKALGLPGANTKSVFYDLLMEMVQNDKKEIKADLLHIKNPKYDEKATVSDEFDSLVLDRFCIYAPILGETRRMLMESPKTQERDTMVKEVEDKLDEMLDYCYKHSNYRILDIQNSVKVQIAFLLLSIDHVYSD